MMARWWLVEQKQIFTKVSYWLTDFLGTLRNTYAVSNSRFQNANIGKTISSTNLYSRANAHYLWGFILIYLSKLYSIKPGFLSHVDIIKTKNQISSWFYWYELKKLKELSDKGFPCQQLKSKDFIWSIILIGVDEKLL